MGKLKLVKRLEDVADDIRGFVASTDVAAVDALIALKYFADQLSAKIEILSAPFRDDADLESESESVLFAGTAQAIRVDVGAHRFEFADGAAIVDAVGAYRYRKVAPRKVDPALAKKEFSAAELRKISTVKVSRRAVKVVK